MWTQIWTQNASGRPGQGGLGGQAEQRNPWSAAQNYQDANAPDGPGQLEVLVGAIPWGFKSPLRHGTDGKRRQKRISGFATEREARRALAQAKVDIDTGRLRYGPRRTVADLATEWLEAVRPNRKASTCRSRSTATAM